MIKPNIKPYISAVTIVLNLAACASYVEDYPPVEDTSQPAAFPNQAGQPSTGQGGQSVFNPQAFQQQAMQQRRSSVSGNMLPANTGNVSAPGGGGPDETRMQQMRGQMSAGPGAVEMMASTQSPGGVTGPRTATTAASSESSARPTANKEALNKGKLLYEQKNFAQAAQEFEAFLKHNDEADEIPEALYYLGNCYFELQDWSKSASAYKKIDQLYHPYPLAPQAALRLAQCYEKMGQPNLADAVRKNMKFKYPPGSYELPPSN